MSSAPFVFISSCWNLISREIFLRRRMNQESISGDCPSTGEYISVEDSRVQRCKQGTEMGHTNHERSDVAHQLSEPRIVDVLHQ